MPPRALLAIAVAAALLAGPGRAHEGEEEPGLRTAEGAPALVGRLAGLHAPGALVVAPRGSGTVDGHLDEYLAPAPAGPGLHAAGLVNGTHLAVAVDYAGEGWFLLGVDLATATRALVAMREQLVARHFAVGGHLDAEGNLTWCAGQLGVLYPDPDAPHAAGHGALPHPAAEVPVSYAPAEHGRSCGGLPGVEVAASRSVGRTRVEVAMPLELLGAAPGDVRHVLLAYEPERRFLPPKVTEEAVRGDLNLLLARPGDDPARLGALVAGAPRASEGLALAAVPLGAVALLAALRRQLS